MPKSTSRPPAGCASPRLLAELRPDELSACGGAEEFLQSDFWGSFKARFGWKAFAFTAEWKTSDIAWASATVNIAQAPDAAGRGDKHSVAGAEHGGHSAAGADESATARLPLLVLYRRLGLGISFAYVPWGPELPASYNTAACEQATAELAPALRAFLPKDTAFIRFDFPWFDNAEVTDRSVTSATGAALVNDRSLTSAGLGVSVAEDAALTPSGSALSAADFARCFVRAAANVQPPDSVLVDLVPDEQTILGNMKSKWRYNIGLAEKKGVAVRSVSSADTTAGGEGASAALSSGLASYYRIYQETAERDGISIHGISYYASLFDEAAALGVDLRLYTASHEGEDIAGIVTLFRGKEAVYLYGASANHKRNLMAPYVLQWKAMRDAKAAGCAYYDMFGIPPRPPEDEPNHPMAGLYRFKTGFIGDKGEGGRIIHRPGSWDYNCRPLAKALYTAAEATRKKIWDIKKRLKRR